VIAEPARLCQRSEYPDGFAREEFRQHLAQSREQPSAIRLAALAILLMPLLEEGAHNARTMAGPGIERNPR
jgi:hypothetical protein